MDGINILLEYFIIFKDIEIKSENNNHILKEINNIIKIIEDAKSNTGKSRYLVDYNLIEKIVSRYDNSAILNEILSKYNITLDKYKEENIPGFVKDIINSSNKGIDNVLCDIMLNVNIYNIKFMNKKTRSVDLDVVKEKDIAFEDIDVELKDVLFYLEVNENDIDKSLLHDLNKYSNIENLKNLATIIKTDMGLKRILFDKISDKNILLSILLHSNLNTIKGVLDYVSSNGMNVNKVVSSCPSIFIKEPLNSKCKFNVLTHYNNFLNNVKLLQEKNVDLKIMTNYPVYLINDYDKNLESVNILLNKDVNVKNVLEHVANILAIKPNVVIRNVDILNLYGIKLTDDNNNNGYTLLGMEDLSDRLDYLIERGLWKKTDGKTLDNLDLIRGLIIKDDYLLWKNNQKYDKLDSTSHEKVLFDNESYNEEKLNNIFEKNPRLKEYIELMDNNFLLNEEGYYVVKDNIISRLRLLKNLCNYNGKGKEDEIFFEALKHKSNNNSEEVFIAIKQILGMGDESVELSKGL